MKITFGKDGLESALARLEGATWVFPSREAEPERPVPLTRGLQGPGDVLRLPDSEFHKMG